VPEENRQQVSILASILLVFLPIGILVSIIGPINQIFTGQSVQAIQTSNWVGILGIIVAYIFSRTQHYKFGAYLVILVPIFAIAAISFTSQTPTLTSATIYLTLSIILSSLLLDARTTVVTGIIISVFLIIDHTRPANSEDRLWWAILMFMVLATSILAVVSNIRDAYMRSLETARKQLQDQIVVIDQARERAEQSDQVKSAFLASMSHELRTPLNAVINFTRFVIDGDTGPVTEQQTELLTEVVGSAKHLLNLINDVLDMSKIEAGSLNLFIEDDVNMTSLVNSAVTTGRGLLIGKSTQLQANIPENLPLIRADRQRILQILLNIISNACKFTDEGSVNVQVRQQADEVLISISDTGPGIAKEDQAMVFEAFKQTKTGLRQGGGTGLGMPIAKNLAEAHGGRLWLESEQGKGATFHVALPIKSETLVPMTA